MTKVNKKYIWFTLLAVAAFSFLTAGQAHAAVIGTSTAIISNQANTLKLNAQHSALGISLFTTANPPEVLETITISIATSTTASSTALSTSSFSYVGVMQDSDQNGMVSFGDIMLATTTVAGIGSTTTINIAAATTTPAMGNFFVIVGVAGTSTFFTDNGYPEIVGAESQKFVVTISTTTGVVASGTFAVISGATTTAPFTADIHSQLPATANISPNYNSSNGVYSISSNGGAGEAGTLNIYSTSTPGVAPFASSTLSTTGQTSASLGTTYYPSIWLDATDIVGNVTSSKVEFVLSTYKPTVTGFSAFTDRIIINVNKNLRGDQAMVCSNYNLNGSALSCSGGPGTPFIEFFGNQVIVKNVTLSGTMSFSVTGLIQSIGTDQFAFTFSTSSIPVQTASVPTITAVSPDTGTAGDTVTLTGTNFGSASGTLLFSGGFDPSTGPKQPIQASTTAWSSTSITTVVPTGGQSGPIQVVNSSGMMSDVNQSTFFSILGNAYIKLALSVSSTPVTTSTNMRIFIGGPTGEHIYYAGDASSTAFNTSTYVYTLPNIPGMGFVWAYDASGVKLSAPGTMLQTGTTSSTPQILVFPTSTPYNVSGTVTLGTSCVNAFKNQNIAVMAMPQGQNVEMGPGGIQPSFFTTNNSCQAAYAIALKATSTYNVEAHLPPGTSAVGLLDPSGQTIVIATSTPTATADFTFTSASHSIYGRIVGGDGLALTADKYNNLWIFAYQPVENGQGTAGRADSSGYFRMYASTGAYKVSVGGPQMPMGFEQDVLVTTSTAYDVDAATPVITIKLSPPTSYIDGYVKDGSSNAIANADVFSYCADGPGGGHSTTDSQGYYKMYVPPCTDYHVNGFSSTYGQFIEQTGIAITGSGSATVNFTINSSDFITISGTVTKNGSAVSGANVWITQGNFGPGVAGGQTDSSGAFSLMVKSGLSNLYVHAAVMGQGELANQQLAAGGTVSSNQTGINLSATAAVLTIQLSPGDTFSQVFLGAHSNSGGGFTNTAIATSTAYDTYQISVPYSGGSTSYTIDGGIPNFGPLPATTTIVTGNATIAIDLSSISYYTVSGSVNGDYAGAFVWAGGTTGGGGTQVNSSGTFSMKLRAGTYDIGVSKPGFIASLLSQQVISTTTAGLSLSLTQSTNTISGTVYYNSTAVSGVRVWADSSGGGWVGDETDANGEFSLSVSPGDWRLRAITDGYSLATPILVTAPVSGISVNLSAVSFQPKQQLQSISPSQGGVVQTSDTKVQVPQGALGSGSTNVQLSVSNTMSTPDKKGAKVIGTGKNISASYASGDNQGQAITTLSSNVTLEFILTKAQLVADGISSLSQAQNMQIGYDDTTSNSWVYIQTTVTASSSDGTWANLESITLSGTTSHFSTYAPVVPTSGSAPATPTGVTATAGNGQVTVSWSAVSGATKYDIYRLSGANYAYFAQTTDTSYANTGLTNGTTYYYEVSALDDSDNESAVSSPVSAAPTAGSVQIISQGGGGGGGGGYVAPTTTATTTIPVATTTPPAATPVTPATPPQAATPNLPPQAISAIFKTVLKLGSQGKDVTRLQELLAKDAEVYPEGKVTGYFGALTEKAVQRFQKKYGIASSGSPSTTGYGILGPKTRAKLAEVFAGTAVPPAASFSGTTLSPSNGPSAPPAVANQAELKAKIQVLQQQVLILLQQLMQLLSAKAGT